MSGQEQFDRAHRIENKFSLFNKRGKFEQASEAYVKAGNLFKLEHNNASAAEAYLKAAECLSVYEEDNFNVTQYMLKAADVLGAIDIDKSVAILHDAIRRLQTVGSFKQAAKRMEQIGNLYLEGNRKKEGLDAYKQASQLYYQENCEGSGDKLMTEVANELALLDETEEAARIFSELGQKLINDRLRRLQVREMFLKSGLCYLYLDIEAAKAEHAKFVDLDATFERSKEEELLRNLIEAVEAEDANLVGQISRDYDTIATLDNWKTSMLYKIRTDLEEEEDGGVV
ncbi:hypothetical protein PCE1_001501 [Barthelona sp. PCE]